MCDQGSQKYGNLAGVCDHESFINYVAPGNYQQDQYNGIAEFFVLPK